MLRTIKPVLQMENILTYFLTIEDSSEKVIGIFNALKLIQNKKLWVQ
jgi:hypothetical protein